MDLISTGLITLCLVLAATLVACRVALHRARADRGRLRVRARVLAAELEQQIRTSSTRIESSERRLREMAKIAPVGIFETGADGLYVYASERWAQITGTERNAAHGDGWLSGVHPDDRERVETGWRRAVERGDPFELEFRYGGGAGEVCVMSQAVPRRGPRGEPLGYVGTVSDVSERRRQEEDRRRLEIRLQQMQKLESLGVLAGGIAHDFNNLLVGILTNADLARMELPEGSPVHDLVEEIYSASRRAAVLTRNMLAYSGKTASVFEPADLSEVVEEMLSIIRPIEGSEIGTALSTGLPAVEADVTQLQQAIMNLMRNAREALPEEGGHISIRTGVIEADSTYLSHAYLAHELEPAKYVFLSVSDNGVGMEPELASRIFDPFHTTKFAGRGLGLAVVLGVVRGHGGAIRVDTSPGHGTEMTLLFPVSTRTVEAAVSEAARPDGIGGTGTILIVDDEPAVREVARRILEGAGYHVLLAEDGPTALDICRRYGDDIAVVLLDMMMPHMSGQEVMQELRKIRSETQVILSSGYSPDGLGISRDAPAGFIQKPYSVKDLVATVEGVTGGEPVGGAAAE